MPRAARYCLKAPTEPLRKCCAIHPVEQVCRRRPAGSNARGLVRGLENRLALVCAWDRALSFAICNSMIQVERSVHAALLPRVLLGRLTETNFLQQIGKDLKTRGRHMPELAFVKIVDGLVESFQKAEGLVSNCGRDAAAVAGRCP